MAEKHEEFEILLVEDNATDAELCLRTLRRSNLANHVVWARDGAEALDILFARGEYADKAPAPMPRLILLDLRLPRVDGMEVLRQVKADERTRTIPVVVLTSSREDRDVVQSYEQGVNSFVSKPVEFEEFASVVTQLGLYWLLVNRPPGTR